MGSRGGSKHGDKGYDIILGIVIPYSWMKLLSCDGFLEKINYVAILKCPKMMLDNYLSKGFAILKCNDNN